MFDSRLHRIGTPHHNGIIIDSPEVALATIIIVESEFKVICGGIYDVCLEEKSSPCRGSACPPVGIGTKIGRVFILIAGVRIIKSLDIEGFIVVRSPDSDFLSFGKRVLKGKNSDKGAFGFKGKITAS